MFTCSYSRQCVHNVLVVILYRVLSLDCRGEFDKRKVAVKRILKESFLVANREVSICTYVCMYRYCTYLNVLSLSNNCYSFQGGLIEGS